MLGKLNEPPGESMEKRVRGECGGESIKSTHSTKPYPNTLLSIGLAEVDRLTRGGEIVEGVLGSVNGEGPVVIIPWEALGSRVFITTFFLDSKRL